MVLYENLTTAERAWMCNGCGPKLGIPDCVPDFIFHEACNRHDFDYWLGGTKRDRYQADRRFRKAMMTEARKQAPWWRRMWFRFLAWRYYAAVRLLGKKCFCFRPQYATRLDLIADMLADP